MPKCSWCGKAITKKSGSTPHIVRSGGKARWVHSKKTGKALKMHPKCAKEHRGS